MRFLIIMCLMTFPAFASQWHELAPGKSYKLIQSFQLPQRERSGSLIDFSKGERLKLKEVEAVSLPGTTLTLYVFSHPNCPGREMTTDMEMILFEGAEIGAQMEDCEINMYIEKKDLYSKSFFK